MFWQLRKYGFGAGIGKKTIKIKYSPKLDDCISGL